MSFALRYKMHNLSAIYKQQNASLELHVWWTRSYRWAARLRSLEISALTGWPS